MFNKVLQIMSRASSGIIPVSLFIVLLIVTSCDSGKEDPLYIGTWQYREQIHTDDIVYNTTRTLILTKNTYEEIYFIQRETSGLISGIFGTKGKIGFSRKYIQFRLQALGTCVRDEMDACTDETEWYGEGTSYWNSNLQYYQLLVKGSFEADELTLHLLRDLNNDNDTNDLGEDIVFERI